MRSVVVFGREPVSGRVKTRLARTIGDEPAAAVYAGLLEHTLKVARATGVEVVLSLAEPAGDGWSPPLPVRLEVQGAGDLGRRMADAFTRRFIAGADAVVLVGSDCPGLRPRHLTAAFAVLETAPVALGPASDGGYWLVAQRPPGIDLFRRVPWSGPDTLAATRARLRALGVAWRELEILDDVDTADDLESFCSTAPPGDGVADRMRAALAGARNGHSGRDT